MNTLFFAMRSTFRNRRRSVITVLTVTIGTVALCIFGGFVNSVYHGIETEIVRNTGQIHIHKRGFFEYGAGRATEYDIADYTEVIRLINDEPDLESRIAVVTPTLSVGGIAGNFDENSSQTFVGVGLVPSDQEKLRQWDAYNTRAGAEDFPLDDTDMAGYIGTGLGRILSLCDELAIADCTDPQTGAGDQSRPVDEDILQLQLAEDEQHEPEHSVAPTAIELLASTADGAPNIIRLPVLSARTQPQKAMDDRLVAMPLGMAQQLVYGTGEPRVTTIVVQLSNTSDTIYVEERLKALFDARGLSLEVLSFESFNPAYLRITRMFATIFGFISLVIAVVVLFTIINNLSMSVMERFNEIGTLRSIGVRRAGIRKQFVWEGAVLGIAGATLGIVAGAILIGLINSAGIQWTPPSNTDAQPLTLNLFASYGLPAGIWAGLVLVTALSSFPPANRAARMSIVDALRHN